jgi:hypothetical protein
MPLKLETEMFLGFLKKDWGFKITDKYPQFLKIKEIKSEKEGKNTIKKEIIKIRKDFGDKMDSGLKSVESGWKRVEKKTFETLSEIIQEEWSDREIVGYVSINPICPRWLDSWKFSVPADRKYPNLVIAHEISHFLFFKKLKSEFPEIGRQRYESPHKEWILSEIVAIIISHDSRMVKILGAGLHFYPEHMKLKIKGKPLTELVQGLYKEFVIKENNFSKFIDEGLKLLKELKQ